MALKRINTLFVLPSLSAGGAERVISFIADNLNPDVFTVKLLVIGSSETQAYQLEKVNITFLNKKKVRNSVIEIFKFLIQEKPDVVISTLGHLNTVMALLAPLFKNIKFVGRETYVRSKNINAISKYNLSSVLQRKFLDYLICQSLDMRDDLVKNYNYNLDKLVVINNPISNGFIPKKKPSTTIKTPRFITVGRIEKQKGYPRILAALSKLQTPFTYTIIGKGSEIAHIKKLIEKYDLSKQVNIINFTEDIQEFLSNSDIYLQGSYVEGFPNALLESCAIGLPAVVFDAPGGINEIIEESINGFKVKDEVEFIEKLSLTINTKWDPEVINASVMKKYNKEKIIQDYENFIMKIALEK